MAQNENIPDAILSDAFLVDLYWRATGDDWGIPDSVKVTYGRTVVATALPRIREQIAREIEAERNRGIGAKAHGTQFRHGMSKAARIARGGGPR